MDLDTRSGGRDDAAPMRQFSMTPILSIGNRVATV